LLTAQQPCGGRRRLLPFISVVPFLARLLQLSDQAFDYFCGVTPLGNDEADVVFVPAVWKRINATHDINQAPQEDLVPSS